MYYTPQYNIPKNVDRVLYLKTILSGIHVLQKVYQITVAIEDLP